VYAFIHSQELIFPVIIMCKVLSVSRSCYYVYRKAGAAPQNLLKKEDRGAGSKSFHAAQAALWHSQIAS